MRVRKIFLIFMLFLLPLQYTWAMAANYDIHNAQDSEAHFGHHEHQSSENHHNTTDLDTSDLADDNEGDTNTQTAKCHIHCGFLHLSCAEVLSHDLSIFAPESKKFSIQYLFNYHSPPIYQPERPNWLAAV
jgi:hypothetical protein